MICEFPIGTVLWLSEMFSLACSMEEKKQTPSTLRNARNYLPLWLELLAGQCKLFAFDRAHAGYNLCMLFYDAEKPTAYIFLGA